MSDFNLYAKERDQYYLIIIEGKFDITNAMQIRKSAELAISSDYKVLLFDLSKTTFIDNNGIRLLLTLYKESNSKGGEIHLVSASPKITKALHSCGIQKTLPLHQSVKDFEKTLVSNNFSMEERGFYILFKLPKEFNLDVVKTLRVAIDESIAAGHKNIVFDFEKTTFITSVGIGLLMNLHKNLQKNDGSIYLVSIPEKTRTLLEDTNILKVLPEYNTVSELDEKFL